MELECVVNLGPRSFIESAPAQSTKVLILELCKLLLQVFLGCLVLLGEYVFHITVEDLLALVAWPVLLLLLFQNECYAYGCSSQQQHTTYS